MTNYDSFSHCHLTDIFFAIHAGAKELMFTDDFYSTNTLLHNLTLLKVIVGETVTLLLFCILVIFKSIEILPLSSYQLKF